MSWFAESQGREVFSVPGHADSFVSKGTNQLLREGAKLVENADDIIEELEPILRSKVKEFKTNQPELERKKQISINPELTEKEAQGRAKLVSTAEDIAEELILTPGKNRKEKVAAQEKMMPVLNDEEEGAVFDLISQGSAQLDEIAQKTNLDIPRISGILLRLQMKKMIKELPGKQYIRSA